MLLIFTALLVLVMLLPGVGTKSDSHPTKSDVITMPDSDEETNAADPDSVITEFSTNFADSLSNLD